MTNIKEKERCAELTEVKKRETVSFKDHDINIGLDVHKKNWSVSIYVEQTFVKTFHQESIGNVLLSHLQTHYPNDN